MSKRDLVSIVDDDESIRQALSRLFRSAGLPIAVFASAEEFLGSPHVATTRCLILDLQMAGMGGLQLQRRLVDDDRLIAVVIVTAHGDDEARVQALAAGAAAFLPKPFHADRLLRIVEAIMKER